MIVTNAIVNNLQFYQKWVVWTIKTGPTIASLTFCIHYTISLKNRILPSFSHFQTHFQGDYPRSFHIAASPWPESDHDFTKAHHPVWGGPGVPIFDGKRLHNYGKITILNGFLSTNGHGPCLIAMSNYPRYTLETHGTLGHSYLRWHGRQKHTERGGGKCSSWKNCIEMRVSINGGIPKSSNFDGIFL